MNNYKKSNIWSPYFMNEFKKWINEHEKQTADITVGKHVNTTLDIKHLVERMETVEVESNTLNLAKYFAKKGGIVTENNADQVFIKTKKGSFYLPKEDVLETDI